MKSNRIKLLTIVVFVIMIGLLMMFRSTPARGAGLPDATSDLYKAKCSMCHSPAAAKFYDAAKPDEEHVHAILAGRKGEKPPNMPAFADKGIDESSARALAEYMRSLRQTK